MDKGAYVVVFEMSGEYLERGTKRSTTSLLERARVFDQRLEAQARALRVGGSVGRVNADQEVELV